MSQQDMDRLLWLHAEAVWGWRQESARASAEGQAADRYRDDSELALWLYAESEWKREQLRVELADAVQMVKQCTGHPDVGAPSHFDLIRRAEASRRDWAAEAEAVARRYQDVLGAIWLYVDWRYVTKQLTTEQKTLWADAVDAFGEEADSGGKADRWWERLPCGHTRAEAERSIRHELCAVHPEADRAGEVDRV